MREISTLSTISIRDYYDADGNLIPVNQWTPEMGAACASIETMKRNVTAGDGQTDTVYKIKLWDKPRAMEMAAKHFGLLVERIEHSGAVTFGWKSEE